MRYLPVILAALTVPALAGPAGAQDADELELDHKLSMAFETPHTNWARPLAGGKLRVLLFCNGRGTVPREGVELMQRFDLHVDAVFWRRIVDTSRQGWHGFELGLKRMLRLAAKPYDCYVFLGVRPSQLTSEMQVKVLDPIVRKGAGIVLVGFGDKRILKAKRRIEKPSAFARRIGVRNLFRVGKGRGAVLPKRPNIPYDVGWLTQYEYWQERFGRAIVWAAGREPNVHITELAVDPAAIDRAAPAAARVVLGIENSGDDPLTARLTLRRRDGQIAELKTIRVTAKTAEAEHKLPIVRADAYHVDAIVRSRRGIETWATVPLAVTSKRRVEAVRLDRDWGEIGGRIRGSVGLAGPAGKGERTLVRLRDRRDRILLQADANGAEGRFDFPVEPWMPMGVRVEAVLLAGDGAEIAEAHTYFNVVKRRRDQFNFLMWDVPGGACAPHAEESLRRLGVTLHLKGGAPSRMVADYGMACVPYTTRILESHDKAGVMKPSCWNDDAKVSARVKALADKYRPARQHGVFVYSLGDENHVRGSCTSDHCLKAYRAYLAKVYGRIEALNASWSADYKSFDDVRLLKADDNRAAEALRRKNYPRWYDRQAFRSYNYVAYCKKFAAAYKAIDPKALTGFEGAGRFRDGDDLDLFVRELGFWSPYPGTADEVLRSIAPKGFPRSNWMGYRKQATPLIAKYWRMVTRGYPSVWWWRWDGIGRFHGFLAPHLGPWPATRELVEETKIVRDGLGALLMHCEMLDDGVAMLFSHPSCYAAKIEHSGSYGGYEQTHRALHRGIRELGLNFRYVTDRMLRRGEFDANRYRVLILPKAEAIGPKEAEAVRAFVRGGGMVIADARPGLYDGHLKAAKRPCLDDLFGVRRTDRPAARKGKATVELNGSKLAFDGVLCDAGIATAGGTAHGRCGDVPLLIVREHGKGRAVLLNFAFHPLPPPGPGGAPQAARLLLAKLLAMAGVGPAIRVQTGSRPATNLEIVRWRDGKLEIAALFRHTGEDEDVTVGVSGPRFVRDLRHGRSLSPRQLYSTKVYGSRPTFLVLSRSPLAKVTAALSAAKVPRGACPRLRLSVAGAAGLHAVRLRAAAPDGTPAEWLDRVVIVGDKPQDVLLPIAVNDPAGTWTLRAIDLFTEEPVVAKLTVTR